MSPGPFSLRRVVAGGSAVLGATALPAGVVAALAAEMPPAVDPGALPAVFDPAAFVQDLLSTGHRVAVHQPVRVTFNPDEDVRPYYAVRSQAGRGLSDAYSAVLRKWRDAIEACPDHVERVVAYGLGRRDAAT